MISAYWASPSLVALSFRAAQTRGFDSTKTALEAPLDRASKAKAPEPAKRSKQVAPGRSGLSQFMSVSLVRPRVGLSPSSSGNGSFLPRLLPLMICTCCILFLAISTDTTMVEAEIAILYEACAVCNVGRNQTIILRGKECIDVNNG